MNKRQVKKILAVSFVFIFSFFILIIMLSMVDFNSSDERKKTVNDNQIKVENNKKKEDFEKRMSLVAVGDCLIHGAVYLDAKTGSNTYDFSTMIEEIKPLIENYDLKYYNQETIIGGKNLGVSHYPRFNSPDEIGDDMVDIGFNLVSLANNHALDKNEEGILYSNNYWKGKNVITAGTYSSKEERDNIKIYETNGIKYAFLAYTTTTNGLSRPTNKEYLLNVYDEEIVKDDINKVKDRADVIIVSMHWGDEYVFEPTESQRQIANYLSSLGVDLIIGSHPHVIQPVSYVNNTLVIYSLGNFLSGQRPMGIDKIIGLMVGMDIVVKDSKVTFENLDYNLLYTYSTIRDTNYKVIPFKNLTNSILNNYEQIEQKYIGIVESEAVYD